MLVGGVLPPIFWSYRGEYAQRECSSEEYSPPSFSELLGGVRSRRVLAREMLPPLFLELTGTRVGKKSRGTPKYAILTKTLTKQSRRVLNFTNLHL